jgi:tetraacyldisaccharide 4'-kinase|tara:strand:- start:7321 stop:8253 length:933 start_codon:yes stop_codon:yes gene_type:complete
MKLNKPKFWDKKYSLISIFLIPITLLVILFIFFKKKFTKIIKFDVPIICIGNIYIGGTGKTPSAILIAEELSKLGRKPVILRKFYKEHKDEYNLIKENFNNLIINKNRVSGILKAQKMNYDSVILDDGFQDYRIKKNLSIICFNQNQQFGNGLVLPSGPLREKLSALKNAEIILINGKKNIEFENKIFNINKKLKIFYANYKPQNIDQFKNKKLLALAGIGNPDNFFKMLSENELIIEKKLIYPDHYEFVETEIVKIIQEAEKNNYQIIMTEKDYFKFKNFKNNKINYLKVSLVIDEKEKLFDTISKIYD